MQPATFKKFLFLKLPIAYIAGIRLNYATQQAAQTRLRLHWLSQNPFKSIFWAVQGMAAELSTGILLVNQVQRSKQRVSFLVIEQRAKFHKKATGRITFTCEQGKAVNELIAQAITTQKGHTQELYSKGLNEQQELVAEFWFTWSVKVKS